MANEITFTSSTLPVESLMLDETKRLRLGYSEDPRSELREVIAVASDDQQRTIGVFYWTPVTLNSVLTSLRSRKPLRAIDSRHSEGAVLEVRPTTEALVVTLDPDPLEAIDGAEAQQSVVLSFGPNGMPKSYIRVSEHLALTRIADAPRPLVRYPTGSLWRVADAVGLLSALSDSDAITIATLDQYALRDAQWQWHQLLATSAEPSDAVNILLDCDPSAGVELLLVREEHPGQGSR